MKKALHISAISIIIVAIVFTTLMIFLNYDKNGESNMPFELSKISVISTGDAQDVEDNKNKWNKLVEQNNDIYIYIEKNKNYNKTETIKEIKINNFKVLEEPSKGEVQFYKPSTNKKELFENKEEYKTEEIIFSGDQKTNIQDLKVSNQGGMIAFRCANEKLGEFISNDNEIKHEELLNKINISYEEIKTKVSFDLGIILENNKEFKTTIELELPIEGIIEEGKSSKELTDLDCVFKRVEN